MFCTNDLQCHQYPEPMLMKYRDVQGDLAIKDAELEKAQTEIADLKASALQIECLWVWDCRAILAVAACA